MSFRDIKGQDSAIDFLKISVKNDKISHAYMFIGPSGVGKKLTAINFAKAINCLDPKDAGPCDTCSQCKKIDASNHPDVFIFSPLKEDSSFGIDRIRALTKDIGLKPYEGRKKVYILDNADSMTPEAQNALLKTLEEPPSDSVLILIVENINGIFSTVQSRAKRVRFFPIPAKEIEGILVNSYKMEKEKAEILSRISSGMLGKALKYNDEDFFKARDRIISALNGEMILDSDFDGLSKPDMRLALDVMLTWYRDILLIKAGVANSSSLVNIDKLDLIQSEAKRSSFDGLNNIINQVILTGSLFEQNVNPKLAMGVLGINLTHR